MSQAEHGMQAQGMGSDTGRRTTASEELLSTERYARAAWSRIAEPGDRVAGDLVAALGPVEALGVARERPDALFERFRPRLAHLDVGRDLEIAAHYGARVVIPGDPEWPSGVDDLAAPPICLWVRGPLALGPALRRSVSIVGARAATSYGLHLASELASGLARNGFCVVSGAAFGIDAAAHRGALAVDGPTVAVLAGGVDRSYPAAHDTLIRHIAEVGAVVSEVAPGGAPTRPRFLLRNRLIATMTRGTVVVEAGLRSGSRNTASSASAHGRVVGAVPGPVTSMSSAGCHEMIRSGMAVLVTDAAEAADAIGTLGEDLEPAKRGTELPTDAVPSADRVVLDALPLSVGRPVDRIAVSSGLAVAQVRSALGRLAAQGFAIRDGSGWRRARSEKDRPRPPRLLDPDG